MSWSPRCGEEERISLYTSNSEVFLLRGVPFLEGPDRLQRGAEGKKQQVVCYCDLAAYQHG